MKSFTLIELLIIIAIFGILALISTPVFRNYQPGLQLSVVVRDLVTDLRYSQQMAVTEQVEHGVRFSTSTDEYQIIKYGAIEEILKEKSLPEKVSFQEVTGFSNDEVKFNPYGAVKEAGNITLINTKNTTSTIDIRPSGFVKIIK